MKINCSPVLTSQNYDINNFDLQGVLMENKPFKNISTNLTFKSGSSKNNKLVDVKSNFAKQIVLNGEANNLFFNFDEINNHLYEDIEFVVSSNAQSNLIVKYSSCDQSIHNGSLTFKCAENSNFNLVIICDSVDTNSTNLLNVKFELSENSKCNCSVVDFTQSISVQKIESNLFGQNAQFFLKSLYFGAKNAQIDLNYIENVFGQWCNATMDCIGILQNNSNKSFKGDIDFKRGAKKSVGSEKEFCLLLSNKAKSKSLPMLLCTEEDVNGSHSSSTGRIDPKQLFYLMSRGLTRKEALKIFVRSKITSVLCNVPNDIKQNILNKIDRKIENEEL